MMKISVSDDDRACRLVFRGSLTAQFAREMENQVIAVLRRYTEFQVDLSGVDEIDIHGIHILGVLDSLGGEKVTVVGSSPAVQRAYERLAPRRGTWLRGSREERARCV